VVAEVVVEEEAEVKAAEKAEEVEVKAEVVEEHKEAEEVVVEEHKEAEEAVTTTTHRRRRQREIVKSDVAGKPPRKRGLTARGVTKISNLFELERERRAEVLSAIVEGEVSRDVIGRVRRKPDLKDVLSAELWTSRST
jgi:hypothetical protein